MFLSEAESAMMHYASIISINKRKTVLSVVQKITSMLKIREIRAQNGFYNLRFQADEGETMRFERSSRHIVAVICLLAGVPSSNVYAADDQVIEEIVVTAVKRSKSIQDVSAALTSFTEDQLEFRDLSNAADISQSVPNLQYGEVAGASQVTIRGIGLNVETGFNEPAVGVHLNGVYLGRTNSAALGLADLASVEVLRGPQGTLYGRNATGGVINFHTRKPTEDFEAGVTLGAGEFDALKGRAWISGPFSDTVRGRLFVEHKEDDGYVENRFTGKDEGGVDADTIKLDLSWDISEDLAADFMYLSVEQEWNGPSFEKLVPGVLFPAALTGFDPEPNSLLKDYADPTSDIEMRVASANFHWQFEHFTLTSITGYSEFEREDLFDGDQTSLPVLISGRTEDAETWSQELNVSGTNGDFDWIVGAFWLQEESTARTDVFLDSFGQLLFGPFFEFTVNELEEEIVALGVFFDLAYSVSDSVRLLAGLRYSDEEKEASQTVTFFDGLSALCSGLESDVSFDDVSPKLGIEWDLSADVMAYGSFTQGFKSGGYNQSGCDVFEPEEVDAIEIGLKGAFLEGRLSLAASVFSYDYSDLQVLQIRNNVGFVENAADSEIDGLEIELKYLATDQLTIDFAASWLDSEYEAFVDPAGNDYSGNRLSRAPKNTYSLGIQYDVPVNRGGIGELRFRAEGYHSSDVYYRPGNATDDRQESYSVTNVYASLLSQNERFEVKAFLKNAGDEEYLVNVISLLDGLDGHYARPRHWGFEVTARL